MDDETIQETKYPNVTVDWSDIDGNAFVLMGSVSRAMRKAGIADSEIGEFRKEATAGDYDHLMQTCMAWVNITYGQEGDI